MAINAHSLITKIKAINGTKLTSADYHELIHQKDIASLVRYLKTTKRYGSLLSGVSENDIHRGQLEFLLSKFVFETYVKLWKFVEAPRHSFLFYFIKKLETELLIHALFLMERNNLPQFVTSMPSYFNDYCSYDLMAVASAKTQEELLRALEDTEYYPVIDKIISKGENQRVDFEEYGRLLYGHFYKWLDKTAAKEFKGSRLRELQEAIYFHLDLQNLIVAYRMKHFFNTPGGEMKKYMFFNYNTALRKRMDTMIEKQNYELEITDIIQSKLSKTSEKLDWTNPEITIRKHELRRYNHKLYHSNNYGIVLYSFMMILEEERKNLTTIIEGVRYGIDVASIEKALSVPLDHL